MTVDYAAAVNGFSFGLGFASCMVILNTAATAALLVWAVTSTLRDLAESVVYVAWGISENVHDWAGKGVLENGESTGAISEPVPAMG